MELYWLKRIFGNSKPFSTIKSSSVTLTTAHTAYECPSSPLSGRLILVVYNGSGSTVYLGGAEVSTSNGTPLADTKYTVIGASSGLFAVCGSNDIELRILECK